MTQAIPPDPKPAEASTNNNEQQRLAFNVLDAVDNMHDGLAALRAVRDLSANDAAPGALVRLPRQDLAALIGVISTSLEAQCLKARAAAAQAAKAA